jgi:hypothetical protein
VTKSNKKAMQLIACFFCTGNCVISVTPNACFASSIDRLDDESILNEQNVILNSGNHF